MPIILLKGPPNAGKTRWLIEQFSQKTAGTALAILPQPEQAEDWQERFLEQGSNEIKFGTEIFSYQAFCEQFFPHVRFLSPRQATFLCAHLLRKKNLRSFPMLHHSLSFARQVAQTLQQFSLYEISPKELSGNKATQLAKDLGQLLADYQSHLEKKQVFDSSSLQHQLVHLLKSSLPAWLMELELVIFDEWTKFDPPFLQVLHALSKALPKTQIVITYPTCAPQQPYAGWLQSQLDLLEPYLDEVIELKEAEISQPTVSLVSVASPSEEARLLAQLSFQSSEHEALTFCLRRNSEIFTRVSDEYGGLDEDALLPRAYSPSSLFTQLSSGTPAPKSEDVESWQQWLMKQRNLFNENLQERLKNPQTRLASAQWLKDQHKYFSLLQEIINDARDLELPQLTQEHIMEALLLDWQPQKSSVELGNARIRHFEALPVQSISSLTMPEMTHNIYPRKVSDTLWRKDSFIYNKITNLLPSNEALAAEEFFLFESWLQKTKHEVVLSYSSFNDEAREQIPSSFVASFFPAAQVRPAHFVREQSWIQTQSAATENSSQLSAQALPLIMQRLQAKSLSASDLERYIDCPYAYFVEKMLRVHSKKDVEHDLLPQDRGTILHKLLEKFYQKHYENWESLAQSISNAEQLEKLLEPLLQEIKAEYPHEWKHIAPSLQKHYLSILGKTVITLLLQEFQTLQGLSTPLLPHTFEWSFGFQDDPLEVQLPSGRIMKLCGKVDRIDVDKKKSSFMILDYKTGKKQNSILSGIKNGRHLQLPLYYLAVQKKFLPQATGLGGLIVDVPNAKKEYGWVKKGSTENYCTLSSPRKAEMKPDDWEKSLNSVLEVCDKILHNIEQGDFQVHELCEHCESLGRCRFKRN